MQKVRVRFAPSPTGMMHLGNVRAALINFLFATQKNGTFVLRIEDTDSQRMFDHEAQNILEDISWLGLSYAEGPHVGGAYAPYYQSQRTNLYEAQRAELEKKNMIYRCFCTQEELEKKRLRQQMLKLAPRYDRACAALSEKEITQLLENNSPFIWRFRCDHNKKVTITDLAHGNITFDLSNFSDFPISRQDGSFTFIFANFVDDLLMDITHIFRGEDHLSNTANQAALFAAVNAPLPIYWHLPILCNLEGKKLSKRDFGFSLRDLKDAGFLPEAILNYLAIIGGSFKDEIMPLPTLAQAFNFEHINASGRITYDLEKLKWVNKHWITNYNPEQLTALCRPYLEAAYTTAHTTDDATMTHLLQSIKSELTTLQDCVAALQFYFAQPHITQADIEACIPSTSYQNLRTVITQQMHLLTTTPTEFTSQIKIAAKNNGVILKELFWILRLAMTGKTNGPGIAELIDMLGGKEAHSRIEKILNLL